MKLNVTDKLFLISIKTYRLKNIEENFPNLTFQPNKIFVRSDFFEKVIKSCKATNLEFLKLEEKLGLCLYEDICDEKEFILMSQESFIQHDVINKQKKKMKMRNEKRKTRNEKLETRNKKIEMTN